MSIFFLHVVVVVVFFQCLTGQITGLQRPLLPVLTYPVDERNQDFQTKVTQRVR